MIKKVILDKADRLYHLPFDLDEYFPRQTLQSAARRFPQIDLGRFHWPVEKWQGDGPGSSEIAGAKELLTLREALASWLQEEFSLRINPRKQIFIGHGIRRILLDFSLAFIEYGDLVLCPEPGLPAYRRDIIIAGGMPLSYQISEKTNYKPSLKKFSANVGKTAKVLVLNSPHNPLGSVLDESDIGELIRYASRDNILLVNDAAYCSLAEEKFLPLLSLPGGDRVSLEIFSVPLTFGLPHIPFGFAVGPAETIGALESAGRLTGQFVPVGWVWAALKAIEQYPSAELKNVRKRIEQSRQAAKQMVEKFDWKPLGHDSAPFLWTKIPGRKASAAFATALLRRRGILTLPGTAFGDAADGYLRLSLTASAEEYRSAEEQLGRRFLQKE